MTYSTAVSYTHLDVYKRQELRRKRQLAHAAFNRLWESGLMTKKQAYLWLQAKLDLPESEAHIARFSEWRCQQVIDLCASFGHSSNHAA